MRAWSPVFGSPALRGVEVSVASALRVSFVGVADAVASVGFRSPPLDVLFSPESEDSVVETEVAPRAFSAFSAPDRPAPPALSVSPAPSGSP